MGFIIDFLKFVTELSKIKDNPILLFVILTLILGVFTYHLIKVFTKSKFDKCFLTKEQLVWQQISQFFYFLGLFNLMCILWGWLVSTFLDIKKLPKPGDTLVSLAIWFFIFSFIALIVAIFYRYYQKCKKINQTKRTEWFYSKISYSSMISSYLLYLLLLFYYFDTRNTLDSYWKLIEELGMFISFSLAIFLFYGFYVIEHFGLRNPTQYSIVLKKGDAEDTLYVLHALDSKNLVIGNKPTERDSKNLFIYNLEKDNLLGFEIKIIKDIEKTEQLGDNLPSRKDRHK